MFTPHKLRLIQGKVFSISYLYGMRRIEQRHELLIVTASGNSAAPKAKGQPACEGTGPARPILFLKEEGVRS
jgi:hypothetical protein